MSEAARPELQHATGLERIAGKYLTFKLGEETYGVGALRVQEVARLAKVTRVPRTANFIRGVANLHGNLIPVVDLRLKLGMEALADTEQTCMIVLRIEGQSHARTAAIVVDEISEVLDIAASQFDPSPSFVSNVGTVVIVGVVKAEDGLLVLLDLDRVLDVEGHTVSVYRTP